MGDWWDGFTNAAGDLGGDILAFLAWLLGALAAAFKFLWDVDAAIFEFFNAAETTTGKIFSAIWNGVFKTILLGILAALRNLHKWLEDHLKPILDWLIKARKWMDYVFNTYIKPFLNLLQHIRQFLEILRLFGVKWAARLDSILAQVQANVAGAFLTVRGILVGLTDIANIFADPLNLLRRPTAVLSIRRIIPSLVRVTTGLPIGFFLPSPRKGAPPGIGPLPLNFNPSDPSMNPPASSYFTGDDGLGTFSGFTDGSVPDDGAVDDLTILEFFDDALYPPSPCNDAATCAQQAFDAQLQRQVATA